MQPVDDHIRFGANLIGHRNEAKYFILQGYGDNRLPFAPTTIQMGRYYIFRIFFDKV